MTIHTVCFKCGTYCKTPDANQSQGRKCSHKTYMYRDKKPPEKLEQVPTRKMFKLREQSRVEA